MNDKQYIYVVRDGKEIIALFPNEQRAIYYCQSQIANLHYQKELWKRLILMSDDKDKIIEELRAEDKRLNDVIINLHKELRQYNKKIKKQNMIINIQWDMISCLMELKGVVEDE